MNIAEVDERDSSWERHDSVFRVYLATGADRAISTLDISNATFSEVRAWVKKNTPNGTHAAIALVGLDAHGRKGLTWLLVMGPNSEPLSDLEFRMRDEMLADGTSTGSL